jgi:hypothetical protein
MAGAEYLLWTLPSKTRPGIPIAVTGGNTVNTAGDQHLEHHVWSGGRFALGYWLTESDPWVPGRTLRDAGAEAVFFFLGERSVGTRIDSSAALFRPFFDLNNGANTGILLAAPGVATGAIATNATLSLWGSEANFWKTVYTDAPGTTFSVAVMAGFRNLNLDQDLTINTTALYNQNLQSFPALMPLAGSRVATDELFATRCNFYGGQFGIGGQFYVLDRIVVDATAKLALGTTHEEIRIEGSTVRVAPGGTTAVASGALLALPSNIGHFRRDTFAQVPELSAKASWPVLEHLTLSMGFTALYWSRIVRPGEQIDRGIDVTQIPSFSGAAAPPSGLNRPAVPFNQTDFWALGLTLGAEVWW